MHLPSLVAFLSFSQLIFVGLVCLWLLIPTFFWPEAPWLTSKCNQLHSSERAYCRKKAETRRSWIIKSILSSSLFCSGSCWYKFASSNVLLFAIKSNQTSQSINQAVTVFCTQSSHFVFPVHKKPLAAIHSVWNTGNYLLKFLLPDQTYLRGCCIVLVAGGHRRRLTLFYLDNLC